jgi:hypothetical protein
VFCLELGLELFPIACREARQPVDLLDKEDVAIMSVGQKPEENRPRQLGAGLVLFLPRHDLQTTLGGESLELVFGSARVLLVGRGSQVGADVAHRNRLGTGRLFCTLSVHFESSTAIF